MVKFITNGQERPVLSWHDLTDKERAELDYRDTDEKRDDFSGFRYRGNVYDLSETHSGRSDGWDGFYNDTYFSGVCYRFPVDNPGTRFAETVTDYVIVGRYYSATD